MIRRFARDSRGATAVEFAMISTVLIPLCLAIVGLGIVMWAKDSMQVAASLAARCGAEGVYGTTACTSTAGTQRYTVDLVRAWLFGGAVSTENVTAIGGASTCRGAAGKFYVVSISSTYFASGWLPPPLGGMTISVQACYPMA
jgi:Flp pilus assembly pilin Flp